MNEAIARVLEREPAGAEETISVLAFGVASIARLKDATPDQIERIRLLVSELDGHVVKNWRA